MAGEPLFAYDIAEQALVNDPEYEESLEIKGRACVELDRLDEAIQYFQKASRISPLRVSTWLAFPMHTKKVNNLKKLLMFYMLPYKQFLVHLLIQLELGEYCVNHHAYTQAIAPLQKAAELVNNNHWSQEKTKGIGISRTYLSRTKNSHCY